MLTKIDGKTYIGLLEYGTKNIEKHKTMLNNLNVFPVPDGDTGTNMLMTLRCGLGEALKNASYPLPDVARGFSSAAVFGARGNSGVIISQFFKGMTDALKDSDEADTELLAKALDSGCKAAYSSVVEPVEGTMLTVLRDAATAVMRARPTESISRPYPMSRLSDTPSVSASRRYSCRWVITSCLYLQISDPLGYTHTER